MISKTLYRIFKQGSKTYFYSSLFFPKKIKEDVFRLYAFVRVADDYVDTIPQQTKQYKQFKKKYYSGLKSPNLTNNHVIDEFIKLQQKHNFKQEWIDGFFIAMDMDLNQHQYKTEKDIITYMYGSAEVVGLMMAKILELPQQAYQYAQMLGRSMQYANFIRDVQEDLELGRVYFPQEDRKGYDLSTLEYDYVKQRPGHITCYLMTQFKRYKIWQKEAEKGFQYIPKRLLIPIKTASDMYKWTVSQIEKDPLIIYQKKVKPSIPRIVLTIIKNSIIV